MTVGSEDFLNREGMSREIIPHSLTGPGIKNKLNKVAVRLGLCVKNLMSGRHEECRDIEFGGDVRGRINQGLRGRTGGCGFGIHK
jgi:hypothetical protein